MSKKRLLIVVAVALALLVSVGLIAAQGSNLPGSGWWSGQQIQNLSKTSNASVVFTAYNLSGTPTNCASKAAPPGGSVNYLMTSAADCPVGANFVGSAVVSADQPIAAIVNVVNMPAGRAAGMYRGTDGADVANSIAFPLVKSNFLGRSTTLYVQNASNSTNNVTVEFKEGGNTYTATYNNVPANAMVVVSPADATPAMPSGVYGSATATGSQPLAGTALEHAVNIPVANDLHAYTAFAPSQFAAKAYCPLIRHQYSGKDTGIQAQNVGGAAQQIRITYSYQIGGSGSVQTQQFTSASIPNGGSANFYTPAQLPANALGSAVVEGLGGGDIAVIVNDESGSTKTAYTCFGDGSQSTEIALPLYKEFFLGDTAGLQIQNVGAGPATVEVTYTSTNAGGQVVKFTAPAVPAGSSTTFYGVSSLIFPPGVSVVSGTAANLNNTYGGVVVTSNQPIVAIMNEEPGGPAASTQDAKLYEGFNQ